MNYRLYTFVAGLYLNELQKGLQTAHVVGELFITPAHLQCQREALTQWAENDKTIIILNAHNHGGVLTIRDGMQSLADELGLPSAIFHEDIVSMNGMATAFGVIVPETLYDVTPVPDAEGVTIAWRHVSIDGARTAMYYNDTPMAQFCQQLKSYRLA